MDSDIDTGLDMVSPATHPARDASHFRAIQEAARGLEDSNSQLMQAVAQAKSAGESWTVIGAALGISRQAAHQRFGNHSNQLLN